ncbi:MAG: hypothetical protein OXN95_03260, partial [bacterium]|nr:hypothetical protein [bacterium]
MKRLLALLMVMGLIVAACGNDDDDAAPDEAAAPEATEAPEAPEAPAAPEEMMLDELNVAYFLEWPTANQVAQAEQTYDDALGLTVN